MLTLLLIVVFVLIVLVIIGVLSVMFALWPLVLIVGGLIFADYMLIKMIVKKRQK